MRQDGWMIEEHWAAERGFLLSPDPALHLDALASRLSPALREVETVAADLAWLIETGALRATIDALPLIDFAPLEPELDTIPVALLERLLQIYAFLASAYIHAPRQPETHRLPAPVAAPLAQIAAWLERPPMLAYASYVLSNWERRDKYGEIALGKMNTVQNFIGGKDESWFILTHVDIEARAADALNGLWRAARRAADPAALEQCLDAIPASLDRMIASFNRMPEGCDPDVYYQDVRRYNMGFKDVIYEGVAAFDGQPQTFRGGSGAQSSIIPALVAGLGIRHETSGLTHHLDTMQAYMPKPHREFIAHLRTARIRDAVIQAGRPALTEIYNECLRQVLAFRQQHLRYADMYIARRGSAVGTGGTLFMDWLAQMTRETERQLLP